MGASAHLAIAAASPALLSGCCLPGPQDGHHDLYILLGKSRGAAGQPGQLCACGCLVWLWLLLLLRPCRCHPDVCSSICQRLCG